MTARSSLLAVLLSVASLACLPVVAQVPKGIFGFSAKVDAEGIFNPTLKSVFVERVQPGLPAALAGVVAGDSIVEVEGSKVAGSKASTMSERMTKKPGEQLVLKLLRANGEVYVATLVAVEKR